MDRLGSSRMRSDTDPSTRRKGTTPLPNFRIISPFLAANMAHQITMVSLATSDGWKLIGPKSIHLRAPLRSGAMSWVNGSSGTTRKTMVTVSRGQAHRCQMW